MTHPHSPLPWTVSNYGDVVDAEGKIVVDTAGIYVRQDRDYIAVSATNYEKMRKALEELAEAEQAYRTAHDQFGDGDMRAGRAWDRMRRAGDTARAALAGE